MALKPIAMEQLKQILQLQADGVSIREMARRAGISRNSVRKYLSLLASSSLQQDGTTDNKALADKAYGNDSLAHDNTRRPSLAKQELPDNYSGRNICNNTPMATYTAIIVIT